MNNNDARVRVTKEMLHRSLLRMLSEQPISKISVKDLCEQAGINRGTFYLHYERPQDVLKEIENDFISENMETFDAYWDDGRKIGYMAKIYTCVMRNRELCRVLMGDNGDPQFLSSLRDLAKDSVIDEWQSEYPSYERERLEFVFDYVFLGSMRLMLNWIDNDQDLTPRQFAHRLERLGHYSLIAAGEFNAMNGATL